MTYQKYRICAFLLFALQCFFLASFGEKVACPFQKNCSNNRGKGFSKKCSNLKKHFLDVHTVCPWCPPLLDYTDPDKPFNMPPMQYNSKKELHDHFEAEHFDQKYYYCVTCQNYLTSDQTHFNAHKKKCDQKHRHTNDQEHSLKRKRSSIPPEQKTLIKKQKDETFDKFDFFDFFDFSNEAAHITSDHFNDVISTIK